MYVCMYVCMYVHVHVYLLNTFAYTCSDLVQFTDEEGYGRFLDLHEVYDMFVNLKQISVRTCAYV